MRRRGGTRRSPHPNRVPMGQHSGSDRSREGTAVPTLAALVLALLVSAPPILAEADCFATCSGGLTAEGDRGPKVGELAPDFRAVAFDPGLGSRSEQTKASLLESRPVILAFGSYT